MRLSIKKTVCLLACLSIVMFAACSVSETSNSDGSSAADSEAVSGETSVSLKIGDSYSITDAEVEDIDVDWSYTIDDKNVAFVKSGKYIVAKNVGNAKITISSGGSTETYNVTVEPDANGDRLLKTTDIKDVSVYLGSGYNAFKANDYFITADQLNVTQTLLTTKNIGKAYAQDDELILCDNGKSTYSLIFQGTSSESYSESYKKQINGALKVDVKGIVSGTADGKFGDLSSSSTGTKNILNTIFFFNPRITYMLNTDGEQLTEIAKKNTKAWQTLTGENGATPEQVFETYGTHILTSAMLGGRCELDYSLSSNDASKSEEELLSISGKINVNLSAVKGEVQAGYTDEDIKKAKESNLTIKTSAKTYGGDNTKATLITDLESYATGEPVWYNSLNENNYTFIGVPQGGLMPIWELLYDVNEPMKYNDRKKALQDYYNEKMTSLASES